MRACAVVNKLYVILSICDVRGESLYRKTDSAERAREREREAEPNHCNYVNDTFHISSLHIYNNG